LAVSRAEIVDSNLRAALAARASLPAAPPVDLDQPWAAGSPMTGREALACLEAQLSSRLLDLEARELKARNEGFYTIGSSGHEANAVVAAVTRPTDPAFLHYRSGAFFVRRARQVPGVTPLLDVLLGIVAAADEPIAGGRHKVFGSVPLNIPPQTSTIASQLPKAVGAAFTLARQERLGLRGPVPADSIVITSFGDASSNHATACTAFNAAALAAHQHLPCPVLFVCEDNGIGISVRTPEGWVARRFANFAGIQYFFGDGRDLADAYRAAAAAAAYVRETRRPAFLHLRVVRLMGHAGSDVEQLYRSPEEIAAGEAEDPVLRSALTLVDAGVLTAAAALDLYDDLRDRIEGLGREAAARPKLVTAAQVVAPLAPHDAARVAAEAGRAPEPAARLAFWGGRLPEVDRARHMAVLINRTLGDLFVKHPELMLFGEDVARKGGVYHVTAELQKRAGLGRVFNTALDETTILGLAIGAAGLGMLPMPEIQYLAYLHNAIDQLRGEACSQQFFTNGQLSNPMVVRIAGLAYQKGFGGHFHNDNAVGALRDIPGLLIATPSNGRDAVGILRTLVASARVMGRVAVFLEPIALYMTKDLHADKDGLWSFDYPGPAFQIPIGEVGVYGDGDQLTIFSYANGLWMSLRVAARLEAEGHRVRVVDLRWLNPLPVAAMVEHALATGRVLVVDECRVTGGVAEGVIAALVDEVDGLTIRRVAAADTYIPLGAAANLVLVQEPDIEASARALLARPRPTPARIG
jgi:2-oxoisovalerate dehydrogenase E1 component